MTDYAAKAQALFHEGYNCSQSVLLAFTDRLPMDWETAARLSASFGGGMGRLREVCGAVSAMFMIAGLLRGYSDPADPQAKAEHYRRVQALAAAFRERHGTILCRELLGLAEGPDHYVPAARTEAYYAQRPCSACIGNAAAIIAAFLEETA
ncbi:MAG: C_GCAxxG_C_C family protein [Oscillospiraceae bacterium]|nr:C_GCAxxG_C_C family protein [Oscillospiraceae bacterium]